MRPNTTADFWQRVDQSADCWRWHGTVRRGQPLFRYQGKTWDAARLAFVLTVGAIPDGVACRRQCATAGCCNPAHYRLWPILDFWAKADRGDSDGCWPWLGRITRNGYGRVSLGNEAQSAHRVAYSLTYGPIPAGKFVCHRCDRRSCCRPEHLWLGDHAENMADMVAKGRQARGLRAGIHTHPESFPRGADHPSHLHPETHQGERNGRAKLTAAQVAAIRSHPLAKAKRYKPLAARYSVSSTTIGYIVRGETWRST